MISVRLAISELLRISSGRLPKVAVLAMMMIPTLYGGLYLYANHDPYSNLNQIPVALVMEDAGATLPGGRPLNAGAEIAHDLLAGRSFEFSQVSAADAATGIRNNRYDFGITIPAGFSAALVSTGRFDPHQGQIMLTTNDANSYLSTTIGDRLVDTIRDSLVERVGIAAAKRLLLGYSTLHDGLNTAVNGARSLAIGLHQSNTSATTLAAGANGLATRQVRLVAPTNALVAGTSRLTADASDLSGASSQLATSLATLTAESADLPVKASRLAAGAADVAAGGRRIATMTDGVAKVTGSLLGQLAARHAELRAHLIKAGLGPGQADRILAVLVTLRAPIIQVDAQVQTASRQLDGLANDAAWVAGGASRLADAVPTVAQGIARTEGGAHGLVRSANTLAGDAQRLHGGAVRLQQGQGAALAGTRRLSASATSLASGLGTLADGGDRLRHGLSSAITEVPDLQRSTRTRVARTIGDPVQVVSLAQTSAGTYGAGLAPFFMALAAWIGAYVLFLLVRPLSRRALAGSQSSLRIALAGWYTPAILGLAQVTVLFLIVWLGLGIGVSHVVGTLAFLLVISATFVAIIHTLNAWLGTAGQFLGLVLLVLQLVSAGGTFPWQTLPGPLQVMHHLLPMTYAIDGLRHLMYGGELSVLAADTGVLAAYLVGALLLSAVAAHRRRIWSVARIKPELVL